MTIKTAFITLPVSIGITSLLHAQGPLTPPTTPGGPTGPNPPLVGDNPAASMKTLHEVEPSTALTATNTPGNASYTFVINTAGAYHLTENILTAGKNGIQITASGVTLNLRGFEIGSSSSDTSGIELGVDADRCSIKNGSIRNFRFGINRVLDVADEANAGSFENIAVTGHNMIALLGGNGWTVNNCRVHGGGNSGIVVGEGSTITHSTVRDMSASAGTHGIQARGGSTISHCAVTNCNVIFGIRGGEGSTIESCSASKNTSSSVAFGSTAGIFADSRCIVRNCTSSLNTHSTAGQLNGVGINAEFSCLVADCQTNKNDGAGIVVSQASVVRNCKSHFNGRGGTGAGIHLRDFDSGANGFNELIGNSCTFNESGFDVDTPTNLVIQNTASGNGGNNYEIISGNRVGTVIIPTNSGALSGTGTNAASGVGTTDPWANFSF